MDMASRGKKMVWKAQPLRHINATPPTMTVEQTTDESAYSDFSADDSMKDPNYEPEVTEEEVNITHVFDVAGSKSVQSTSSEEPLIESKPHPIKKYRTKEAKLEWRKIKYQLLAPCTCTKRCFEKISAETRERIFNHFIGLEFNEVRLFVDKFVRQMPIKKKSQHKSAKIRSYSYKYSLLGDEKHEIEICKEMFLHTLGRNSDSFIVTHFKSKVKNKGIAVIKNKRGEFSRHNSSSNKIELSSKIRSHIESFQPVVSHYRLQHSPNRRYLSPDLNVKVLWKDYCSNNDQISYETYRKMFVEANIGFTGPAEDDCPSCSLYRNHITVTTENASNSNNGQFAETIPESSNEHGREGSTTYSEDSPNNGKTTEDTAQNSSGNQNITPTTVDIHNEYNCNICEKYKQHHQHYISARKSYTEDASIEWDSTHSVFCVDMQKVVIIPKMTIKNSYFVSRMVVFNETFATLQNNQKDICVLWNESISGRRATDVASTYFNIIKNANAAVTKFLFWADKCSGQNKNWLLFTTLVWIVNQNWGPDVITLKYFEPGHSYMKADSIHGRIGAEWKRRQEVLTMDDFEDVIITSGRNNKILKMLPQDFKIFQDGMRSRKKGDRGINIIPNMDDIKVAQFRKNSRLIFYKKHHNEKHFMESKFLKEKFIMVEQFPGLETPRGINTAKKQKIIKELIPHMPPRKQLFWKEIPESNTATDLCFQQN